MCIASDVQDAATRGYGLLLVFADVCDWQLANHTILGNRVHVLHSPECPQGKGPYKSAGRGWTECAAAASRHVWTWRWRKHARTIFQWRWRDEARVQRR